MHIINSVLSLLKVYRKLRLLKQQWDQTEQGESLYLMGNIIKLEFI